MSEAESRWPAIRGFLVRVAFTGVAVGLWWWLSDASLGELFAAVRRIPLGAVAAGFGLFLVNYVVAAVRWAVLLLAFGATRPPSVLRLSVINLIGMFYNMLLPANVGGDVLRGHVTRACFDSAGGAYVIVFIERVFGLAGLLLLAGSIALAHPIGDFALLPLIAGGAVLAALTVAFAPLFARGLGARVGGRIGEALMRLPVVERPALLAPALALSVVVHGIVAVVGYVLLASLDPGAPMLETLALVPLALVAMYFPTVAGLGARESAFLYLLGSIGVGDADATAVSLGILAVQLLCAAAGGLVQLLVGGALVADAAPGALSGAARAGAYGSRTAPSVIETRARAREVDCPGPAPVRRRSATASGVYLGDGQQADLRRERLHGRDGRAGRPGGAPSVPRPARARAPLHPGARPGGRVRCAPARPRVLGHGGVHAGAAGAARALPRESPGVRGRRGRRDRLAHPQGRQLLGR